MTASRPVLIECDYHGCTRTRIGGDRIRPARREAQRDGWIVSNAHDYCPKHARPVSDLFAYTGRHTAEGMGK